MVQAMVLTHAAATLAMVGLIGFVQIVHYPMAAIFGSEEFARQHVARTSRVVMPLMLLEAASAVGLVVLPPPGVPPALAWIGLGLLTAIWISTACLQVPAHSRLVASFDPRVAQGLVHSNWIRTVLWSLRGGLALALLGLT